MTIWAFNKPNENQIKFVMDSLEKGVSRFGWGYIDTADIRELNKKNWGDMTEEEQKIFHQANFLSGIKKGDWIVHINVPWYGQCTAGQVIEEYDFDKEDNEISDFRHFFKLDLESVIRFDRNDANVHPLVSRKLKLRGKYWRVYAQNEFFESIERIKNGESPPLENSTIELHYLKKEINPHYSDITKIIQRTHPEKKLEYFLADIFKNIPNVTESRVNGSGRGTDHGADIIVKYNAGLEIFNLNKEDTLVVQVKSYEREHHDTHAVDQIKTAIEKFNASAGMIISTAKSTENLEKEIENASNELDIPISLIAGEDVAKFVLKYGKDLLFDDI